MAQLEAEQQRSGADAPPKKIVGPEQPVQPEAPEDDAVAGEKAPKERKTLLRGHPIRILIALVVLAAMVVGGLMLWSYESSFETTDDAEVDGHIYPLSPRISGRVTDVKADNNQMVNAGQVLVQMDPTDYQVALQKAQADLQQSQADAQAAASQIPIITTNTSSQLSNAGAGVQEAAAGIAVAQQQYEASVARVREAEANANKAQKDVERYRPLVEKQEISQQQFDQAVASARALSAAVDTARASADATQRQIEQARARLGSARAQEAATRSSGQQIAAEKARAASSQAAVGVQRATVEQAKLTVGYTSIQAPIAGLIGQRNVQVGQQVQPGQELMSVIPLDDLWITANFKETQLKNIHVGQKVSVHADATGRDYHGHVDSFPGATGSRYSLLPPENATGNYVKVVQRLPVKIVLDAGEDKEHLLRPGMSVEPKVAIK